MESCNRQFTEMRRVCWYSPLDKTKTEIARYSLGLLPSLGKVYSVQVLSDDLVSNSDVCSEAIEDLDAGSKKINFYHLGNNSLHKDIYLASKIEPGIVVLHDSCVQSLALSCHFAEKQCLDWPEMMEKYYGSEGKRVAEQYVAGDLSWDELACDYPLFQPFLENSLGVLVHSKIAYDQVIKFFSGPVSYLPLPYESQKDSLERNYNLEKYVIVFCGHAGPNRRLSQFIKAWGSISKPARFELRLYGLIPNVKELKALAKEYGVAEYIRIPGFVSDSDLESALSQAHLAINFRYPSMGEASAGQLRLWSHKLPTLVSDTAWYSECPDDAVFKISITNDLEDIKAALELFLRNPEYFKRLGESGKNYLESNHTTEAYIEGLNSFVDEVDEYRFAQTVLEKGLVPLIADLCATVESADIFMPALSVACSTIYPAESKDI